MASLTRYQPHSGVALRDAIDRLFEDSWILPRWMDQSMRSGQGQLPANLYENNDVLFVQLALPGISVDETEITVRENILRVRGQYQFAAPENARPIWQGFGGNFEQSYTLPWPVDSNAVEASYERGILTLRLPKAEQARTKRIPIKHVDANG